LFKFGVHIPDWYLCWVYYMVFTIKGQTKAAVAFKGVLAIYWPILFKFGVQIAYW
jgi:quinol-cytochrome oxidoreductase complex cytochrome b subunit